MACQPVGKLRKAVGLAANERDQGERAFDKPPAPGDRAAAMPERKAGMLEC